MMEREQLIPKLEADGSLAALALRGAFRRCFGGGRT